MTLDEAIHVCRLNYANMDNSTELQNIAFQLGTWLIELREYKRRFPNFQFDSEIFKEINIKDSTSNLNSQIKINDSPV